MVARANGLTSLSITPSHWLTRRVVAPLNVIFETATRSVDRYEGRVPPQQRMDGKHQDLAVRVEYVMHVATYR